MNKLYFLLFGLFLIAGCNSNADESKSIQVETDSDLENDVVKTAYDLVNPFVGTGGHGHTFPGATLPFGMVQLSPDTRLDGWDGCGGYHYTDSVIYGFSHTHLSGTGVSDYGDVLLSPYTGQRLTYFDAVNRKVFPSKFDKTTEKASPGYYSVELQDHQVKAELTTTTRSGMHRYTNNSDQDLYVLLDLRHRDKLLDYDIEFVDERTIRGKRVSEAWAAEQHIYFYMQFSEPFSILGLSKRKEEELEPGIEDQFLQMNFGAVQELLVKVGISAVDTEGAKNNLFQENNGWDFEGTRAKAKSSWERELAKIEVSGGSEEQQAVFYTALYHTMIAPNTFSDIDGRYRGLDKKIHVDKDHTTYTVFSLWDTFRSTHPLYTIIDQNRTNEYINTFLKHYKQGGKLPIWELAGNYTGCMIGYHAIPVIADAHVKGITNWNVDLAYEAMIASADADELGLPAYRKKGFIEMGDEPESVSKQLEYAYDDWCIASMGERIEHEDHARFYERAQFYKNLFDPETGFMRGRNNGMFQFPFDPAEVNFCFTEANSWQYSMFAPQDISGLISLYGGPRKFEQKLDELFSTEMELSGRHQVDITGLIGQYAHGNEPSHHMAYLYNYIGKPWKTAERVDQIIDEMYSNQPDGLCGNEDCGQMSSWYVMSAMGFYPVTPGTDYYAIGHPIFDSVVIHLENGNDFTITANRESHRSYSVKSCQLNGENHLKSYLTHGHIMNGGHLHFDLTHEAGQAYGTRKGDLPETRIDKNKVVPPLYIVAENYSFVDSMLISVRSAIPRTGELFITKNGQYLNTFADSANFWITETSEITAMAEYDMGVETRPITAVFRKRDKNMKVTSISKYANQYSAGGDQALIDGIQGGNDFKTGFWQGVQGEDFEVTIDLGKIKQIGGISVGCFQDIKSWIWMPELLEIYTSTDGKTFNKPVKASHQMPKDKYGSYRTEIRTKLNSGSVRYIKVRAKYPGDCPNWHLGAGGKAWIFLDEISLW